MNMDLFTNGQPDKGWKDEMCIATYYNGGSKGDLDFHGEEYYIRVDDFGCKEDHKNFLAVCLIH